eukprot:213420-Pelagomonas_calceolata.AAC.7
MERKRAGSGCVQSKQAQQSACPEDDQCCIASPNDIRCYTLHLPVMSDATLCLLHCVLAGLLVLMMTNPALRLPMISDAIRCITRSASPDDVQFLRALPLYPCLAKGTCIPLDPPPPAGTEAELTAYAVVVQPPPDCTEMVAPSDVRIAPTVCPTSVLSHVPGERWQWS